MSYSSRTHDVTIKKHRRLITELGHVRHDSSGLRPLECLFQPLRRLPKNIRAKGVQWCRAVRSRSEFSDVLASDPIFGPVLEDQWHVVFGVVFDVTLGISVIGKDYGDDEGHFD